LRLTEVQQPKTTATLSTSISCLAFSANKGQFEAGSTITGSIIKLLPPTFTPPDLLTSSNVNSNTSFNDVSLMAMVPLNECSTPTLTVSAAIAAKVNAASAAPVRDWMSLIFMVWRFCLFLFEDSDRGSEQVAGAGAEHDAVLLPVKAAGITGVVIPHFGLDFDARYRPPIERQGHALDPAIRVGGLNRTGGSARKRDAFDPGAVLVI
jgi:hypothetical protein